MTDVPLVTKTSMCFFLRNLAWLFLKQIQIITESVKIKKLCLSWKMFEMEFELYKCSAIRSKTIVLSLTGQGTAHTLRHQLVKQVFVKENEKNTCIKKTCKIVDIVNSFSS